MNKYSDSETNRKFIGKIKNKINNLLKRGKEEGR